MISSTAASPSGTAGSTPVLANAPDAGVRLCPAGTKVIIAELRVSLADRNDCDVLGAVEEAGAVLVCADELGGAELVADELGAGELWLGEAQVAVGKNWPRVSPPACASTCTKHLPAAACSNGTVT